MKKTFLLLAICLLIALISACTKANSKQNDVGTQHAVSDNITHTQSTPHTWVDDDHIWTADNSATSIDWAGEYIGTIPSASGSGIETQITLNPDKTYRIELKYLDSGTRIILSGKFRWDSTGGIIKLENLNPEHYATMYRVGEGNLTQLDLAGNTITGDLADKYRLLKNRHPDPVDLTKQPSHYLGTSEIVPLFAGRLTIADWIKDMRVKKSFYFYIEGATGEACLNVGDWVYDSENYIYTEVPIARFYVETNDIAQERTSTEDAEFETLPKEILALKVNEVLYLDFEAMGIPYNIRGITNGTTADAVKKAFLDLSSTKEQGDWTIELYNTRDIDPNTLIYDDNVPFLHGEERYPSSPNDPPRTISYNHAEPFDLSPDGNGVESYSIYCPRSVIIFEIDNDEKVSRLIYSEISHRN